MARLWLGLICLCLCCPLFAVEADKPGQPLWEFGAAMVAMSLPDYVGSERQRNYLLPYPYIIYRGDRLRLDGEGLRGILMEGARAELDFSVGGALPVNSDDNPKRRGMPDLDAALEIGPSLKWSLLRRSQQHLRLELPVRALFIVNWEEFNQNGWIIHPRFVFDAYELWGTRVDLNLKLGINFMDQTYNRYYYGVPRVYATADRSAYSPEDGYGGFNASMILSRRWGDWFINGFARYDNINRAEFVESPLVETKHAFRVGINLVWILSSADE